MENVKVFPLDDGGPAVGEVKAERDSRDRLVDRDGDRASDPIELRGVEVHVSAAGGSEDPHLVVKSPELAGEVAHMIGHAARRCKVVRRDEPDLHGAPSQIRWGTCHCSGCRRMSPSMCRGCPRVTRPPAAPGSSLRWA